MNKENTYAISDAIENESRHFKNSKISGKQSKPDHSVLLRELLENVAFKFTVELCALFRSHG